MKLGSAETHAFASLRASLYCFQQKSSSIQGSLYLQSQRLGMPDGVPQVLQDWQQNVLRCSYALEKSLELVASGSASKVPICQQRCHQRSSQRMHSSHRYTCGNYMKTFINFSHNVKVASFADIRAILSSYSVTTRCTFYISKYTEGTVQNNDD